MRKEDDMSWQFDETRSAYTLDAAPYAAVVTREPQGEWTARIDGPGWSHAQHDFTWWEDAAAWCEQQLEAQKDRGSHDRPPT
jgi:hypothetical protein